MLTPWRPTVRELLILTFVAIAMYIAIATTSGFVWRVNDLFFSTPDSLSYREVSAWIYGGLSSTRYLADRPILYPLLLGLERLGGVYCAWLVQGWLWLAAALMLALAVGRATHSFRWALTGLTLFVLNPTLVAHTFHGLTETTVIFLLSAYLFIASGDHVLTSVRQVGWATLVLSLLTITKPIYKLHLLFFLVAVLMGCIVCRRHVVLRLASVAAGLVPVGVQLALMLTVYGTLSISKVGDVVVYGYLVPAVYAQVEHMDIDTARQTVSPWSLEERRAYAIGHPQGTLYAFLKNIDQENISVPSGFFATPSTRGLQAWSRSYNNIAYGVHFVFLLLVAAHLYVRRVPEILLAYGFALLTIASSGLVYWGGDRHIAMACPLWLFVYLVTLHDMWPKIVAVLRARHQAVT